MVEVEDKEDDVDDDDDDNGDCVEADSEEDVVAVSGLCLCWM